MSEYDFVLATHNPDKVQEFEEILGDSFYKFTTAGALNLTPAPETGHTLEANAILKAESVVDECGYPAIADDTGLFIEALGGDPGVHGTAGWADTPNGRDFVKASKKVLDLLAPHPRPWRAEYRCVIVYSNMDGFLGIYEGETPGEIVPLKGPFRGFGYECIFRPFAYHCTYADMPSSEKNRVGHRGIAMQKCINFLDFEC